MDGWMDTDRRVVCLLDQVFVRKTQTIGVCPSIYIGMSIKVPIHRLVFWRIGAT
jgi:hypothetical protein